LDRKLITSIFHFSRNSESLFYYVVEVEITPVEMYILNDGKTCPRQVNILKLTSALKTTYLPITIKLIATSSSYKIFAS